MFSLGGRLTTPSEGRYTLLIVSGGRGDGAYSLSGGSAQEKAEETTQAITGGLGTALLEGKEGHVAGGGGC